MKKIKTHKFIKKSIIGVFIAAMLSFGIYLFCEYNLDMVYKALVKIDEIFFDSSMVISEEYHVYTVDKLSQEDRDNYKTYFEKVIPTLPLYDNDYSVILTNHEIKVNSRHYGYPYLKSEYEASGACYHDSKIIILRIGRVDDTFSHEIGHVVDYEHKFSSTEDFRTLFDKRNRNCLTISDPKYVLINEGEYFAALYCEYMEGTLMFWENEGKREIHDYFENILDTEYVVHRYQVVSTLINGIKISIEID